MKLSRSKFKGLHYKFQSSIFSDSMPTIGKNVVMCLLSLSSTCRLKCTDITGGCVICSINDFQFQFGIWEQVWKHTRCFPVKAWPPACSIRNDIGKTSYRTLSFHRTKFTTCIFISSWTTVLDILRKRLSVLVYRSFPFGLFWSAGYKNMPPYSKVRWTSATMLWSIQRTKTT